MFDLNKLGDMTKMAKQAREMQAERDRARKEQTDLLVRISSQLETVIDLLKEDR